MIHRTTLRKAVADEYTLSGQSSAGDVGVVKAIAFRPTEGAAMSEIDECQVVMGCGLQREGRKPGRRNVTLLSASSWNATCADVGATLPWHTRRANLLIEGLDLAPLIGGAIMVGDVRLWIHGETRPCALMDELHQGLRAALVPDGRGGVFGQALCDGTIRVGDQVTVALDAGAPS